MGYWPAIGEGVQTRRKGGGFQKEETETWRRGDTGKRGKINKSTKDRLPAAGRKEHEEDGMRKKMRMKGSVENIVVDCGGNLRNRFSKSL
jgi:hypothetical protein